MANPVIKIIVSLGSNTQQQYHLEKAKSLLQSFFGDIAFTESLWTEPIGMDDSKDMFLNALGCAHTNLPKEKVILILKKVEALCGRQDLDKKNGIVKIDADLLLYNHVRCHEKDWQRGYVKLLLKELD